jgi:hypothetical protein
VLNFNGRVTMASVKNFQLVDPEEQNSVLLQVCVCCGVLCVLCVLCCAVVCVLCCGVCVVVCCVCCVCCAVCAM